MDASEIYLKRLNAKEVIFPKQGEFLFPIADGLGMVRPCWAGYFCGVTCVWHDHYHRIVAIALSSCA